MKSLKQKREMPLHASEQESLLTPTIQMAITNVIAICIMRIYVIIKPMFYTILAILVRILSNSYLNVFQKLLTGLGQKSSVVNFYTYLGLGVIVLFFMSLNSVVFSFELLLNVFVMGALGAIGNYFIIKALSIGELSTLAPINSYKPVVALLVGFVYLQELPSLNALYGIFLIIAGTYFIFDRKSTGCNGKAVIYRALALICSGTEAVFIKKIILLSDITSAFVYWVLAGLLFATFFVLPVRKNLKVKSIKYQICLILMVALMQYSTNFVFARLNVSYALALFQLSTLLSVFLGASIFHERNFRRKILASLVMVAGAVCIILD